MEFNLVLERVSRIVGSKEEVLLHLANYRGEPDPASFALIKISGQCLEKEIERISQDIADLCTLKLTPIITHGWGKSLTKRLTDAGITSVFVDGDRYTDIQVMSHVGNIAQEMQNNLFTAIKNRGAKVEKISLERGVLLATEMQDARYGTHNGKVFYVNAAPIYNAVYAGKIPVISPIGISPKKDKQYNINAAVAGAYIASAVETKRYILITDNGGVLDADAKPINNLSISQDYRNLVDSGILHGGMLKNVDEAQRFLTMSINPDAIAQIISPKDILPSFFSSNRVGTLVTR